MPKIYERNCEWCGKPYKGRGKRFCGNSCSRTYSNHIKAIHISVEELEKRKAKRKEQKREISKRFYYNHPEKMEQREKERSKQRYKQRNEYRKVWNENNLEYMKIYLKTYMKTYMKTHREYFNAKSAEWRARCKNQTILSPEYIEEIVNIYKQCHQKSINTSILHHVDHIVPLRGKNVHGFHVPWNLQIIPATENFKKHNYFNSN